MSQQDRTFIFVGVCDWSSYTPFFTHAMVSHLRNRCLAMHHFNENSSPSHASQGSINSRKMPLESFIHRNWAHDDPWPFNTVLKFDWKLLVQIEIGLIACFFDNLSHSKGSESAKDIFVLVRIIVCCGRRTFTTANKCISTWCCSRFAASAIQPAAIITRAIFYG